VLRINICATFELCASCQGMWFKSATTPSAKTLGHMLKTRPTNGTFGFDRHISRPFSKLKEPFFANAPTDRATIYQTLFILKNDIIKI